MGPLGWLASFARRGGAYVSVKTQQQQVATKAMNELPAPLSSTCLHPFGHVARACLPLLP
ncbi:MAG: hypothetical protein K6T86_11355 [Pirellulales bacterium]|nr:hypothetical protein [Pirellulales bacterium]